MTATLPPIADGATKLLGIVGDPILQVRSPPLWSALFRYNKINAICVPFHVHPAGLDAFLKGLRGTENLLGLLVTIPHKIAAAGMAHMLTTRAQGVGTANILRPLPDGRWEGDTLDGEGFVRALRAHGQTVEGRRALIAGAGGVGSAIAFALAGAGAVSLGIADIDPNRADALAKRLAILSGVPAQVVSAVAKGFDLIVNATPMGMRPGDPMPVDLTDLTAGAIVADVVISAIPTPFLAEAAARGCFTQAGSLMTDHQVAAMADFLGLETGDWGPAAIKTVLGE